MVLARVDPEDDGWLDDAVLCHRCFAEPIHGAASSLPHAFEAPALAALGETFDACVGAGER